MGRRRIGGVIYNRGNNAGNAHNADNAGKLECLAMCFSKWCLGSPSPAPTWRVAAIVVAVRPRDDLHIGVDDELQHHRDASAIDACMADTASSILIGAGLDQNRIMHWGET